MTKKAKKRKELFLRIFASVLLIFGYTCCVLPVGIDTYSRIGQTATISGYDDSISMMSDEELAEAWQKSNEYNQKIYEQQQEEPYVYTTNVVYDEDYLKLPVETNREIGTIVIKKINVNVSTGHGTDDELLQKEAGHLYGTSLPTGGINTHSVIAAHSALQSSELFTRLDELEKGDYIDIKVLNQTHRYVIDQIITCLPDECNQYLQIEEGKDLITLYTCTPYGINTHRLLVRGSRIEDPVEDKNTEGLSTIMSVFTDNTKEILKLAGLIIFPIVLVVLLNIFGFKKSKKLKSKKSSKDNVV